MEGGDQVAPLQARCDAGGEDRVYAGGAKLASGPSQRWEKGLLEWVKLSVIRLKENI